MSLARRVNDIAVALFLFERRIDPSFRPLFNRVLREPIATAVQALINLRRPNEHLAIAAERLLPNEEAIADAITEQMAARMRALVSRLTAVSRSYAAYHSCARI